MCAECLNQLKDKYPQIERYKILSFPEMTAFQKEYYGKNYDGTIYLDIGTKNIRNKDRKRNQMMVDNSDFIIFYCAYFGRVSFAIEYAKQKKKEFINLGSYNP